MDLRRPQHHSGPHPHPLHSPKDLNSPVPELGANSLSAEMSK